MTDDTITAACRECGRPASLSVAGLAGAFRQIALNMAANLLCEECAAEEADQLAVERREKTEREVRELWARRLKASGVPRNPKDFAWPESAAADAARRWASRQSRTLVLTGPVGTGKTTLARAAFRERCKPIVTSHGQVWAKPAAWRSATAYMAALGSGFGSKMKDEAAELAQGGWLLGLDDLDKTRPSEYAAEAMFALIDGAVASGSPLIVTMNADLAALAGRFGGSGSVGEAIASRLAEGDVVRVEGTDLRFAGRSAA